MDGSAPGRQSGSLDRAGARALVVAGAGLPGLSLALALKRAHGPALAVSVLDPGLAAGAARHRGRAYALAAGPRRMFERLGLWPEVEPAAQVIRAMVVTDSRLPDPVRPTFLTFGSQADETGVGDEAGAPHAHMIEAEPLAAALLSACRAAGVELVPVGVARAVPGADGLRLDLADGRTRAASLLVAADGARSRLREAAGIGWVGRDYPQRAVVATVRHARDHEGRAYEHFLPGGPFAILPLRGNGSHRSSIVWTERPGAMPEPLDGPRALPEIEARFGGALGRIELEDGPSAHPLSVGIARRFGAERLALLGDAAHVVHPIAGQGLNLGLAGAAALAEAVTEALRLGLDPGAPEVVRAYERARRFDTVAMIAMTDGLNRLFSNDRLPLRLARDLGLGLVDRMPGLKRMFAGEAAALRGAQPRLLRGEAL